MKNNLMTIVILIVTSSCVKQIDKGTFEYDIQFLRNHKEIIVLKNNNNLCQVAVCPAYQGRVMTSTSNGLKGKSYGWINYELISTNKLEEHINVFGGEDRFWLGPEGGQYSIFFKKGNDFTLKNWNTPREIDTEPFPLIIKSDTSALFKKKIHLVNYQGFEFDIEISREISILNKQSVIRNLKIAIPDQISFVGFQSENIMRNIGSIDWSKEKGLLSIWILGMFIPTENTMVIIPYKNTLNLNSRYFGEISPDRLHVTEKAVLFKGDGKHRCKIGLPPDNALPFFGSYDSKSKVLTIVEYSFNNGTSYVNSLWEFQNNPYSGDVINSYNDGPLESGKQLGPFYELESSSAANELKTNDIIKHIHKTYHFQGRFDDLNLISKKVLNIDLSEIKLDFN